MVIQILANWTIDALVAQFEALSGAASFESTGSHKSRGPASSNSYRKRSRVSGPGCPETVTIALLVSIE